MTGAAEISYQSRMAQSSVQRPHLQDYDGQTVQPIPHEPVTFVKSKVHERSTIETLPDSSL
jgi:hypothetical protein